MAFLHPADRAYLYWSIGMMQQFITSPADDLINR